MAATVHLDDGRVLDLLALGIVPVVFSVPSEVEAVAACLEYDLTIGTVVVEGAGGIAQDPQDAVNGSLATVRHRQRGCDQ